MIKAEVVADSVAPSGVRLTTFVLTYPRFVHAEFMTHRMFSRNASSSRAIPVEKQIQMVLDNPAIPLVFTKNKKGMQGGEPLDEQMEKIAKDNWLWSMESAVKYAKHLANCGLHKQYANRILEPYAHITVVCTATDFENFFALRMHSDAQPEMRELATQMGIARSQSKPVQYWNGGWHLPFAGGPGWSDLSTEETIKCSVARCARVSYLNHEGKSPSLSEDLALYDRLVAKSPIHASPAEHQAMAVADSGVRSGNFRGWIQYRKTLRGENIT